MYTIAYNLVPLPKTRRGYGTPINVHPATAQYIYCSGKTVVIRSLDDDLANIVFTEHKADASIGKISPCGVWVCSGDVEGTIIIWRLVDQIVKYTYNINKSVLDVDWDADSQRVAVVGDGSTGKVKVITIDSGNSLGDIGHIHTQQVLSCTYRPCKPVKLITCSEDMTVVQYDGIPFKYNGIQYKGHTRYPNKVKYSYDGSQYISVGADSKIVLYDGSTGNVIKEFGGDMKNKSQHSGAIVSFDWSSDNQYIVTCSLDKTCRIWSVESGESTHTFTFGTTVLDQQVGVCWHKHNNTIISISLSGAINYLHPDTTSPARVLHGHQSTIQSMALNPHKSSLYTTGLDGEICEWNLVSGSAKWLPHINHANKIVSAIAVNDRRIYSAGLDNTLRITTIDSTEHNEIPLKGQPVSIVVSNNSADPIVIVACVQKFFVVIRDSKIVQTLAVDYTPNCMQLTHDNTKLYVGDKERKSALNVYNINNHTLIEAGRYADYDKPINDIAISADDQFVATVDSEASVYVRDGSTLDIYNKTGWRFHQGSVQTADFSPNGILATGSIDFGIILWNDLQSFNASVRVRIDRAHPFGVMFLKFISATEFISIGADLVIKKWRIASA